MWHILQAPSSRITLQKPLTQADKLLFCWHFTLNTFVTVPYEVRNTFIIVPYKPTGIVKATKTLGDIDKGFNHDSYELNWCKDAMLKKGVWERTQKTSHFQ